MTELKDAALSAPESAEADAKLLARAVTSTHDGCPTIDILRSNIERLGAELLAHRHAALVAERDQTQAALDQVITDKNTITQQLIGKLEAAERDLREARAANEYDRTKVAEFVTRLKKTLSGYDWLITGRGSYSWNDDRWHEEFRRASESIREDMEILVKIAADWSNCPKTAEEVQAARLRRLQGGEPLSVEEFAKALHNQWLTRHGLPRDIWNSETIETRLRFVGQAEDALGIIADRLAAAPSGGEWVSVKERLPEEHVIVLVLNDGHLALSQRGNDGDDWFWCDTSEDATISEEFYDFSGDGESTVTHWRELPAPPAAEPEREGK